MVNFPSLKEFMVSKNFKSKTIAELADLKREYRNLYHAEYMRRRKNEQTITIRLPTSQHKILLKEKKNHSYTSLNKFILDCTKAYLDKAYVFPNLKETNQVCSELQKISNVIIQVVHKLHRECLQHNKNGNLDTSISNLEKLLSAYELLKNEVDQCRIKVETYMTTPQQGFLNFDWDEIKDDKKKLNLLISFLADHKNYFVKCQSSNHYLEKEIPITKTSLPIS